MITGLDVYSEETVALVRRLNTYLNNPDNQEAIEYLIEAYLNKEHDWSENTVCLRVMRGEIIVVDNLMLIDADPHTYSQFIRAMVDERIRANKRGRIDAIGITANTALRELGIRESFTHPQYDEL